MTAYRYDEVGLLTLRSWEVPANVTGVSLGISRSGFVLGSFAQAMQQFVVSINLSVTDGVSFPKTLISDPAHFNIHSNPIETLLLGTIVKTVLLVDDGEISSIK